MNIKRAVASIIDYFPISIITSIIVAIIIGSTSNMQGSEAIPFLIMIASISPLLTTGYLAFSTIVAAIDGRLVYIYEIFPYLKVILIIIILNAIFLTIIEAFSKGYTLGRLIFGIKVISLNGNYSVLKSFVRNLIKSASRYMLYIPFLSIIFRKDNKSIYDIVLNTEIIDIKR